MSMLLERYDAWESGKITLSPRTKDEISRAIAIAQAVEEDLHCGDPNVEHDAREIVRRADELLEGK